MNNSNALICILFGVMIGDDDDDGDDCNDMSALLTML